MLPLMKNAAQILKEAKAIIADPSRWTKGAFARDKYGTKVYALAPAATCFCALGAVYKAADAYGADEYHDLAPKLFGPDYDCTYETPQEMQKALDALSDNTEDGIVQVNDEDGHEAVLAVFDKAISSLEALGYHT